MRPSTTLVSLSSNSSLTRTGRLRLVAKVARRSSHHRKSVPTFPTKITSRTGQWAAFSSISTPSTVTAMNGESLIASKHRLLYCHSIALDDPFGHLVSLTNAQMKTGQGDGGKRALLRFINLLLHLAPLLRTHTVCLLPSRMYAVDHVDRLLRREEIAKALQGSGCPSPKLDRRHLRGDVPPGRCPFLALPAQQRAANGSNRRHKAKDGNCRIPRVIARNPAAFGTPPQRAANDVFSAC